MSAQRVEERATGDVVVRFRDNEILEGHVDALDFGRSDFELVVADPASNNRRVIVPLASIKLVLLDRMDFGSEPDVARLQKLAIHFWDGEVMKGLAGQPLERHRYGMVIPLISPALDEIEVFGIPYTAVKAVYYVKAWDSRSAEFERETGHWKLGRVDTPLLDLLGEIRGLTQLRTRGHLSDVEYERKRREVLERI
jgi:hypothetical protein